MAIKTQGSKLYILDESASAGPEVLAIDCATSLNGLNAPREQIEVTCLEDDSRSYVGGLGTPGDLTVKVNFDPNNESHYRIYQLWVAGDNFDFAIAMEKGATAPTIASDGSLDISTSFNFITGNGFVKDIPLNANLNSVWTADISIQLSERYVILRKVVS